MLLLLLLLPLDGAAADQLWAALRCRCRAALPCASPRRAACRTLMQAQLQQRRPRRTFHSDVVAAPRARRPSPRSARRCHRAAPLEPSARTREGWNTLLSAMRRVCMHSCRWITHRRRRQQWQLQRRPVSVCRPPRRPLLCPPRPPPLERPLLAAAASASANDMLSPCCTAHRQSQTDQEEEVVEEEEDRPCTRSSRRLFSTLRATCTRRALRMTRLLQLRLAPPAPRRSTKAARVSSTRRRASCSWGWTPCPAAAAAEVEEAAAVLKHFEQARRTRARSNMARRQGPPRPGSARSSWDLSRPRGTAASPSLLRTRRRSRSIHPRLPAAAAECEWAATAVWLTTPSATVPSRTPAASTLHRPPRRLSTPRTRTATAPRTSGHLPRTTRCVEVGAGARDATCTSDEPRMHGSLRFVMLFKTQRFGRSLCARLVSSFFFAMVLPRAETTPQPFRIDIRDSGAIAARV